MESAKHFSSRPECNNTAEVPWFCVPLSQQSRLFLNGEVSTYSDSRMSRHRLYQISGGYQCKWLFVPVSAPRTSASFFSVSFEVLVLHGCDWIHWVAISCTTTAFRWLFRVAPSSRTMWFAVIKSPLAYLAIPVFREVTTNSVFPGTSFLTGSLGNSREELGCPCVLEPFHLDLVTQSWLWDRTVSQPC